RVRSREALPAASERPPSQDASPCVPPAWARPEEARSGSAARPRDVGPDAGREAAPPAGQGARRRDGARSRAGAVRYAGAAPWAGAADPPARPNRGLARGPDPSAGGPPPPSLREDRGGKDRAA